MPVFSCEPDDGVKAVIEKGSWKRGFVYRNNAKMGCWMNTFLAAHCAMNLGSELNLYLEDDYELSRDALTLVEQWAERDDSRTSVLCLRRPHATQEMEAQDVVRPYQCGLFGCGFAWRSELWPTIRQVWWKEAPMWDIAMEELDVPHWRPLINRSHGFGVDGTHCHQNKDPNLIGPMFGGVVTKFKFEK